MRRFWRVGIAQNVVFFRGFAGSESQLLKTGECGGSAAQDVAKICTTLWRESGLEAKIVTVKISMIWPHFEIKIRKICSTLGPRAIRKSKSLKTGVIGAFFESWIRKICTML